MLCLGFGLAHLSGFLGPGMWTSDEVGVVGSIRFVKPAFNLIGLAPFCYGIISSHHIIAGFFGTFIGTWHISSRLISYMWIDYLLQDLELCYTITCECKYLKLQ
jgi:hypothetical protein